MDRPSDMQPARAQPIRLTYEDYLGFPDDGRRHERPYDRGLATRTGPQGPAIGNRPRGPATGIAPTTSVRNGGFA
jgi:hypothetical protein